MILNRIRLDPIQTLSTRRIHLFWDNTYPEPVRLMLAESVAFAHPGHTTESLCAALAQEISTAGADDDAGVLEHVAFACAINGDPYYAARALGVTLAEFDRSLKTLNRHSRNQVRLEAARAYARAVGSVGSVGSRKRR